MKKTIAIFALLLCSFSAFSQEKKDTTIAITVSIDEYRALLYAIDTGIDSKKVSKDLLDFISKKSQIVADKPKETIKGKN